MRKQFKGLVTKGAILVCSARPAFAQTAEERAGARAAAEQGVKAYAEGRWAAAVDLMTRAEKLVHAPTHLLYLAQAEEQLGHLVVAHETYLMLAREKLARDAPEAFAAAQTEARSRAEALRPRLSQVSIVVQGDAGGAAVAVTMDNKRVPEALVGVPHPVDPGEHDFEASGEGVHSSRAKVTLHEGAFETIVLTLRPTGEPRSVTKTTSAMRNDTPSSGQPTPNSNSPATPVVSPAPAQAEPSGTSALKIGGYIGLGLGAVGLATGAVFALRSSSLRSDADAFCNDASGGCPEANRPKIEHLDSDANTSKGISTAGFIAGGVGIAAGITMLLLAPLSRAEPRSAMVLPYVGGNGAGVWGRF